MKISPVGAEFFHADRWTDGQTNKGKDKAKFVVTFRNFENSPKMISIYFEIILF